MLCITRIYVKILRVVVDILWSFRPDKSCRSLEFLVQLQGGAGVPKGFDSPLVSLDLCKKLGETPSFRMTGWPDDVVHRLHRIRWFSITFPLLKLPLFWGYTPFSHRPWCDAGWCWSAGLCARHCFWEQQGKLDRGRGHVNKYSIASGNCYTKG